MGFVRFTSTRARLGDPQVSIWSRGQIGFNQGAIQEFDINNYQYVVIFYDTETQRVGFQLTNDKNEKGALKLIFRKSKGVPLGISISAIPFLKINKINYIGKTSKYSVEQDADTGFLVIDLKKPL